MNDRNFRQMLEAQWARGNFVCVGLDSEFGKIPKVAHPEFVHRHPSSLGIAETIVMFNRAIVEATKDLVCAYKPNAAFYETHGAEGLAALRRTIVNTQAIAPDVPVILDGNTNAGYVEAAFGFLRADAITVHPYLGAVALLPFLARAEKGIIVLCRTSNPGADEFQNLRVSISREEAAHLSAARAIPMSTGVRGIFTSLSNHVAYQVAGFWNSNGNCGLVVDATCPHELQSIRGIVGDMPILMDVGFQQKDVPLEEQVKQMVSAGKDSRGQGMIINSSRGIIFASKGADFAEAARRETKKLRDLINQCR